MLLFFLSYVHIQGFPRDRPTKQQQQKKPKLPHLYHHAFSSLLLWNFLSYQQARE